MSLRLFLLFQAENGIFSHFKISCGYIRKLQDHWASLSKSRIRTPQRSCMRSARQPRLVSLPCKS